MLLRVLGDITAADDARPVKLGGRLPRRLLATLVASGGGASSDALADVMWGGRPPNSAAGSIHAYVSRLRSEAGTAVLDRTGDGYRLGGHVDVDAWEFERRCSTLDGVDDASDRLRGYDEALALWRGPAFGNDTDHPLLVGATARLDERRLDAKLGAIAARLDLGEHRACITELRPLCDLHPYRERLRELLMLALYRDGRRAEALDEFVRARTTLVDDLGLEPGPSLTAMERAVLDDDPALAAPGPSAAAVRVVTGTPLPAMHARDAERRALTALSAGSVALVSGEAGIGKSLLVGTALPGSIVVRCWEGEAIPGWPWPQVCAELGAVADRDRLDSFEGRQRAASRIVDASRSRPSTVVVEDVHWADDDALLLLRQIAENSVGTGLTLVTTFRPDELSDVGTRVIASLRSEPHCRDVPVGRLSPAESIGLVAQITGDPTVAAHTDTIEQLAGGNPFHLRQLAARVAGGTGLTELRADPRHLDPERSNVVLDRLVELPDSTRETLRIAASVGIEFGPQLVGSVLGRPIDDDLLGAESAGIIEHAGHLIRRFTHPIIHDAVRSVTDLDQRAIDHQRIADVLAGRTPTADVEATISWHRHLGRSAPGAPPTFELHRRVADDAERAGAWRRAATSGERAAAAGVDEGVAVTEIAHTLARAGRAWRLAGDIPKARSTLAEAAASAERHAPNLTATIALDYAGFGAGGFAIDERGVGLLERAARLEGLDEVSRVQVDSRRALAEIARRGQIPVGELEPERILERARETGDERAISWALGCRLIASIRDGDHGLRLDLARELRSTAADEDAIVLGLVHEREALVRLGRAAAARRATELIGRRAASSQRPAHLWFAHLFVAGDALRRGALDLAEAESAEALTVGGEAHGAEAIGAFGAAAFHLAWLRDDLETFAALDPLSAVDASVLDVSASVRIGGLILAAVRGERAAWVREVDEILEDSNATPDDRALIGELAVITGDSALIPLAVDGLAVDDRLIATPGCGYDGSVTGHLARMALLAGDVEGAVRPLRAAVELERGAEYEVAAARSQALLCWTLRRLGMQDTGAEATATEFANRTGVELVRRSLERGLR